MKGGAVLLLLGITASFAYSIGRGNAPASPPVSIAAAPARLLTASLETPPQSPAPAVAPVTRVIVPQPAVVSRRPPDKLPEPSAKRKVEEALTAAAIAAIIIQASRAQYHAGGRPCACPDDRTRGGQSCGGRSAYSRPGGAAPLCYVKDVTTAMIDAFRQRQASR